MFGVLAVDKPPGMTSRDVVNVVQRLLRGTKVKVGHTGTLDPLATGVLLLAIGRATRLVDESHGARKCYTGRFRLGCVSESLDTDTEVQELPRIVPTETELRHACDAWLGQVSQVPPKYSAVHIDGRRAYDLARAGVEFEVPSRQVTIEAIHLDSYEYPIFQLSIRCGTGTYIRTLGNDIAKRCNTAAIMTELQRTRIGSITLEECVQLNSLNSLEDIATNLLPAQRLLEHLPSIEVGEADARQIANGIPIAASSDAPNRCYSMHEGQLVAMLKRQGQSYRADKVFRNNSATTQPRITIAPHKAES